MPPEKFKIFSALLLAKNSIALIEDFAAEAGLDPLALAVAWVARHKAITAPIISARNQAQLAPSLQAAEIDMNDQFYQVLCDLTPTPPPATDRGWPCIP